MKTRTLLCLLLSFVLFGQTSPTQLRSLLEKPLLPPEVVAEELRRYLIARVPGPPRATTAEEWTRQADALRDKVLREVVFHGWPKEWVEAPVRFQDLGSIPTGGGYKMRKLRYEIVPGLFSSAILYEPETLSGKAPAILNVNGHVGAPGKAVEYKQKRCINQAKRGIVALNLEWLSFGELTHAENLHWYGAHLDLAGANAIGLFYLAMRKGLDFLYDHPNVDRARLGVTGLSGGGWQTIILSSLDERVTVSVPVAGYSSFRSRVERAEDTGDIEQNATDLVATADYPALTAFRAPRPTLLVYNVEDDCCFRAPLVKPYIYDDVRPVFSLYRAEHRFAWHENTEPSDHNYQLDNRLRSYRFFSQHFGQPEVVEEIPAGAELKTFDELKVGLPPDNLTILGVAKRLAAQITRAPASPEEDRKSLRSIVRYQPVSVERAGAITNTKRNELETASYRLEFTGGLSASCIVLRAIAANPTMATVVINDGGKKETGDVVSDRLNREELVLALDLLFTGDAAPRNPGPAHYAQMIATTGGRPLSLQAAQLIAVARWVREATGSGVKQIRIDATGMRSQVVALVASALDPPLFSEVAIHDGISTLAHLLDKPVPYETAPELFCLDLYRRFDLDRLSEMAAPVRLTQARTSTPRH